VATTPAHPRKTLRHILGLLALLAWLGTAWAFWQPPSVLPRLTLPLDLPNYSFVTVPAGSPFAVINPSKDELAFLDVATGRKAVVLKGDMKGFYRVIESRNRETLATLMIDGTVKVWHLTGEGEPVAFSLPAFVYVACSPDGKMVAGHGPKENTTRLWDVASQKEVATFDGHLGATGDGFFPDNRTLATATGKGVKLWDLATRQERYTLEHRVRLYAIAPDGQSLATCDAQDRVTLWDCATGRERASYPGPDNAQWMFFSPDGSKVGLCVSSPNATRLSNWFGGSRGFELMSFKEETEVLDVATGQNYGRVPCSGSNVCFADDKTLATLSKTGDAIQLWDLPPGSTLRGFAAWACLGVAVLLTGGWWYARP
jgi:WD40 repeat protein